MPQDIRADLQADAAGLTQASARAVQGSKVLGKSFQNESGQVAFHKPGPDGGTEITLSADDVSKGVNLASGALSYAAQGEMPSGSRNVLSTISKRVDDYINKRYKKMIDNAENDPEAALQAQKVRALGKRIVDNQIGKYEQAYKDGATGVGTSVGNWKGDVRYNAARITSEQGS